jgi:xanthine dehydrogenase accessory factor
MLVLPGGQVVGTVGGGPAEAQARRAAREVIRTGEGMVIALDLVSRGASGAGPATSGRVEVLIEPVG